MIGSVALIGHGEVGRIFARDLTAAGVERIAAYDIVMDADSPACPPPARAAMSAAAAVAGAGLVVSAVTASAAVDAARSIASAVAPGAIVLDVNSVSPSTRRAAFAVIEAAGARYVEAAVVAAVQPYGLGVPILLGGPHASGAAGELATLGFKVTVHSDEIGVASAVKMCRSVLMKGLEALFVEAMVAARCYGVENETLASLAETFPHANWRERAGYMIGRAMRHGRRRSEEMEEAARTVEEAGLSPALALAVAARQAWAQEAGGGTASGDLSVLLDALNQAEAMR